MQTGEIQKLAELRSKTDRQLLAYLSAQLNRALALAEGGESPDRAGQALEETRRLLPLVREADASELRRLEARMNEVGQLLDEHRAAHSTA